MLDDLTYNVVLNVIEYLNVLDSGRLAATSKRHLYLVCEYRRLRGPEVVVSLSWDASNCSHRSAKEVVSDAIHRMQKPPNMVIDFSTIKSMREGALSSVLEQVLPSNVVVMGACAQSIQVNPGRKVGEPLEVDSASHCSVMFASFPDADIRPFTFERSDFLDYNGEIEMRRAFEEFAHNLLLDNEDPLHWKSIIVYSTGQNARPILIYDFVEIMQSKLPNISIVGGICGGGYVSHRSRKISSRVDLETKSIKQLRALIRDLHGSESQMNSAVEKSELVDLAFQLHLQSSPFDNVCDGVYGVVLGGSVPVRSVVSRGLKSIPTSPYVVSNSELIDWQQLGYLPTQHNSGGIHMIDNFTHRETGSTIHVMDLLTREDYTKAKFIGVRRPHEDGFELLEMDWGSYLAQQALMIPSDGSSSQANSLVGAEVDFFYLDGEACCQDVDRTLSLLRDQTQGEEILGAIMFSCSGRGPRQGHLIREDMMDATRFARAFPDVPCLGFYAGGEIGPMALVGNQNVFRKGRSAVQGFTAVFCLFIVPVVKQRDYELDDSLDAVHAFIKERLTRN
jgi:small ligand-binding sensory domain FIST